MHRDGSAAFDKAFITYTAWLKEYFMTLDSMIEADHTEALEMNIALNPVEEVTAPISSKKNFLGRVYSYGASTIGYGRVRILSREQIGRLIFRDIACAVHWSLSGYVTGECVSTSFSKLA